MLVDEDMLVSHVQVVLKLCIKIGAVHLLSAGHNFATDATCADGAQSNARHYQPAFSDMVVTRVCQTNREYSV